MQTLVEGAHYFQNIGFKQHKHLFERLANEQKPVACFITCSDSRIDPNLITNAQPGQLFIVRNVGNIIPCYGTSNNGELAAVEFAVNSLGVKDIIVCGHTPCGAMQSLLNPDSLGELPTVQSWLRHADATTAIIKNHYSHLTGDALHAATAEENVLVQLEHLRTLPSVAARVTRGLLGLHGWMYKIATGEMFAYDSETTQFVKFGGGSRKSVGKASGNGRDSGGRRKRVRA
jgi:carbonic anhydrase